MNKESIQIQLKINSATTEEQAIELMMQGLNILLSNGALKGRLDEILLDYKVDLHNHIATAYLKNGSLLDGSKLNTIGGSKVLMIPEKLLSGELDSTITEEDLKSFSAATLKERLRLSKQNPKVRFRYLIVDYKKYFKSNKDKFIKDPKSFEPIKSMFLTDLMGLFNEILPYLKEGKQLSSLLGVSQVGSDLNKVSRDLSMMYKRALTSESSSGSIPKNIYSKLKTLYNEFIDKLLPHVFEGIEEITSVDSDESVIDKTTTHSDVVIQSPTEASIQVDSVLYEIKELFTDDEFSIILLRKTPEIEKLRESLISDLEDIKESDIEPITSIPEYKSFSNIKSYLGNLTKTYSILKDGRVDLFSDEDPNKLKFPTDLKSVCIVMYNNGDIEFSKDFNDLESLTKKGNVFEIAFNVLRKDATDRIKSMRLSLAKYKNN